MSLFPISPTNGQTTTVNGTLYTYNSAQTAWIRTNAALTNALVVNGNISVSGSLTSGNLVDAVGYKGMPQNARTSQYTLALSDMGFHISITTGGIIIPANSSVAFPIGSTVVVYNNSATTQTISITADTLIQAGTTTNTGPVVLDAYGVATLIKVASTVWVVSGNVAPLLVNYLLVGGGGGGGGGNRGGGGGGGQVISNSFVCALGSYTVTIGLGGAGAPASSGSSGSGGVTSVTGLPSALGGTGGNHEGSGRSANGSTTVNGSGSGGWNGGSGGTGSTGGFNGGATGTGFYLGGGGGGGAGAGGNGAPGNGANGGIGGLGITSSITGSSVGYGFGGGGGKADGGSDAGPASGSGPRGLGGNGGTGNDNGTSRTAGGNGGSGVVIFSYPTGSITATGGTITTSGSNTIHTFTSDGTFQRTA